MIGLIGFIIVVAGISYACELGLQHVTNYRCDVSCRCGRKVVRDVIIVDPIIETRYRRLLTEECPFCQSPIVNRQSSIEKGYRAKI